MPSFVDKPDLPRANAMFGVAEQISRLAGPLLGGALMVWASVPAALGFNALTFFLAAGTVSAAPRTKATSGGAVFSEIRAGLSYARRNVEVRIVLLVVAAGALSYSGLFAVGLPALSRNFSNGSL